MATEGVAIRCGEIALEGELALPGSGAPCPGVVVCHPHPQMGGDMDSHVVETLVRALDERGIATLRFNFRGAGSSGGSFDGGRGERDDVRAACAYLAGRPEIDAARVGLAGYSFGAAMSALAADARCRAVALVSLPTSLRTGDGARSPAEALAAFAGGIMLITGDRDQYVEVGSQRELASALGRRAELVVVPGVDHFWMGGIAELATSAGEFFTRSLA